MITDIINGMRKLGLPVEATTPKEIEAVLRDGLGTSDASPETKDYVMRVGVDTFLNVGIPEPEKPNSKLEWSKNQFDWLMSLGIPGAQEAIARK